LVPRVPSIQNLPTLEDARRDVEAREQERLPFREQPGILKREQTLLPSSIGNFKMQSLPKDAPKGQLHGEAALFTP